MRRGTLPAVIVTLILGATVARAQLSAGVSPIAVATGDFNNDGKVDLAVANNDSDDVSVLFGNGDGTFLDSTPTFPTGSPAPAAIAVGDFNGDTKLDIITANEIGNSVSVLLGTGGTTFNTAKVSDTGNSPESVVVADFDGDGKLDAATADNFDATVTILKGAGDGTFTTLQSVTVGSEPVGLVLGDLNGDHKMDLIVTNSSGGTGTGSITVLKGMDGGMFEAQPEITSTTFDIPVAITLTDLNGDSKLDAIVVNEENDTISVLLGNGDLTFQPATTAGVGSFPEGVVAADFNIDGRMDIATSSNFDDKVSVLIGLGNGSFMPPVDLPTGMAPFGIAAADFNKDGKPDIVTANMEDGTVSIETGPFGTVPCVGDCNASGDVTVSELITLVNIALGDADVSTCTPGDANQNGKIEINEIIAAVHNALSGCP